MMHTAQSPMTGFPTTGSRHWHLSAPALYETAIRRQEGLAAADGPLVVRTGSRTGRSPDDKFIVQEPSTAERIAWGDVNRPMAPAVFDALQLRIMAHFAGRDAFIQDCTVGADPQYCLRARVITEFAWHSLFARNLFLPETDPVRLAAFDPTFTVIAAPTFKCVPDRDGTHSEVVVVINFAKKIVLIAGTEYAGEIKKSMFTVMNVVLPPQGVLTMHASVNVGPAGDDAAVFFGLSGTGKTTLSAEPGRTLIGDDEHGWSDHGLFNFEGGCYAKVIKLSPKGEPEIYATTRRFATVLENVVIDPVTRQLDLDDASITENTRAAYPLSAIPNASPTGMTGQPRTVVMLTCDAFGILPPVARLSPDAAMYYFLLGYTAKVAGTEAGVTGPKAVFSTCFGAPFMALDPECYADMLRARIAQHKTDVWLVNTGWIGGAAGDVPRVPLAVTRAIITAIHDGSLAKQPMQRDPVFGFEVPQHCPAVADEQLQPRLIWADPAAYDSGAVALAKRFTKAFQIYAPNVPESVRQAGPKVPVTA
ncbi:MAG: phosphoenolpyruvate carboxykinase (ATP) [Candidatus Sericytochromatia bacterium]|nr:phosphoenolpyruvate carboxykinase (ATP) [Candidatus Sericytochromatia bacterium]